MLALKKGNPTICDNMDKSRGLAKWNKPDKEWQILGEKAKLMVTEDRIVVTKEWGMRKRRDKRK